MHVQPPVKNGDDDNGDKGAQGNGDDCSLRDDSIYGGFARKAYFQLFNHRAVSSFSYAMNRNEYPQVHSSGTSIGDDLHNYNRTYGHYTHGGYNQDSNLIMAKASYVDALPCTADQLIYVSLGPGT